MWTICRCHRPRFRSLLLQGPRLSLLLLHVSRLNRLTKNQAVNLIEVPRFLTLLPLLGSMRRGHNGGTANAVIEAVLFVGLGQASFWSLLLAVDFLIEHQFRHHLAPVDLTDISLTLIPVLCISLIIVEFHVLSGTLDIGFLVL